MIVIDLKLTTVLVVFNLLIYKYCRKIFTF